MVIQNSGGKQGALWYMWNGEWDHFIVIIIIIIIIIVIIIIIAIAIIILAIAHVRYIKI